MLADFDVLLQVVIHHPWSEKKKKIAFHCGLIRSALQMLRELEARLEELMQNISRMDPEVLAKAEKVLTYIHSDLCKNLATAKQMYLLRTYRKKRLNDATVCVSQNTRNSSDR